jgi:hypothetical protein
MSKTKKLLGLAAVGVSLFGVATAYWRRNQIPSRTQGARSVQVSRAAATTPTTAARRRPSKFQEEQIEQVRKHQE